MLDKYDISIDIKAKILDYYKSKVSKFDDIIKN